MNPVSAHDEEDVQYLKQKMYDNFRKGGMLDSLKAQLRSNLLEKLQKKDVGRAKGSTSKMLACNVHVEGELQNANPEEMLRNRLMYSIVAEFLREKNLNYTIAVFLPEIAIGEDKLLLRSEMIDLLNLRDIAEKASGKNAMMLDLIVRQFEVHRRGSIARVEKSCQTYADDFAFDIEKKLDRIGLDYQSRLELDLKNQTRLYEEKMTRLKRDYEARLKAELNAETTRIREFEMSAVRLEEAEKYRLKMESYRSELETSYQEKLSKLKERERDTIEKCKEKMREIENASHEHRQRILKDLDLVKLKEEEVMSKRHLDIEAVKMQRGKVEEKERDVSERLREVEEKERRYESKLKEEIEAVKYKMLLEMDSEKISLYSKSKAIEEELKMIPRIRENAEDLAKKNTKISEENLKLREENQGMRSRLKELERDNQQYSDNLKLIRNSGERDQGVIRTYEVQIKALNDEIHILKGIIDDHRKGAEERKSDHAEIIKKYQRDAQEAKVRAEQAERDLMEKENHRTGNSRGRGMQSSLLDDASVMLRKNVKAQGLERVLEYEQELEALKRLRETHLDKPHFDDVPGPKSFALQRYADPFGRDELNALPEREDNNGGDSMKGSEADMKVGSHKSDDLEIDALGAPLDPYIPQKKTGLLKNSPNSKGASGKVKEDASRRVTFDEKGGYGGIRQPSNKTVLGKARRDAELLEDLP